MMEILPPIVGANTNIIDRMEPKPIGNGAFGVPETPSIEDLLPLLLLALLGGSGGMGGIGSGLGSSSLFAGPAAGGTAKAGPGQVGL